MRHSVRAAIDPVDPFANNMGWSIDFHHRQLKASPHTRGWTLGRLGTLRYWDGFPAHAGMDPSRRRSASSWAWLPRTRGDGPIITPAATWVATASPHTRGWTRLGQQPRCRHWGFPAHAGMDRGITGTGSRSIWLPRTRGDGPGSSTVAGTVSAASPHTRGWTAVRRQRRERLRGFPAHAGMDPYPCRI